MKLIVQIPCLNESDSLSNVLRDIPAEIPGIDCIETLVIDDGSSDDTATVATDHGAVHVIRHRRNRGLAAAFQTGIDSCLRLNADIIVNTDGDNQYPGQCIPSLVEPIVAGRADIVVGDRNPERDSRNKLTKRVLYRIGRIFVGMVVGQDIPDPVSGFRAISREAAERTSVVSNYTYTIETLVLWLEKGMMIEFVGVVTKTVNRPSRLLKSSREFVFRSAATLLRVFFMYHPLQSLSFVSCTIFVIGLIPVARFLFLYAFGKGDGHVQSLVIGTSTIVVAILIFVVGLLADLVAQNRRLLEAKLQRNSTSLEHAETHYCTGSCTRMEDC
ncbi:MAG TPA: glycosyl transferase [Planctomycetaceae bacterium]|nr:glycosyl transferase [Planctomycetaceae bacterium]